MTLCRLCESRLRPRQCAGCFVVRCHTCDEEVAFCAPCNVERSDDVQYAYGLFLDAHAPRRRCRRPALPAGVRA